MNKPFTIRTLVVPLLLSSVIYISAAKSSMASQSEKAETAEKPVENKQTNTNKTPTTYRYVDENGVTHFTDIPTKGAEQVKVEPLITTEISVPSVPKSLGSKKNKKANRGAYDSLAIIEPSDGALIRNNAGTITLKASVQPGLNPEHKIRFFLDGKPVNATPGSLSVTIEKANYGEHTANFIIVDPEGKPVDSSETIKFHLLNRINRNN